MHIDQNTKRYISAVSPECDMTFEQREEQKLEGLRRLLDKQAKRRLRWWPFSIFANK